MASAWEGTSPATNSTLPAVVPASPQDILQELKLFLQGATCQRKVPVDTLAQSALYLLQRVPAARNAVLEHFCNVFDDAVALYIGQMDNSNKQEGGLGDNKEKLQEQGVVLQEVMLEVTRVLLNFISTNPDGWAPIVSSWSLTLLGQISSKYSTYGILAISNSLNDVLQLWMTCPATKLLMDMATECFAAMVGGAPDSCVDALLEASVQYSPHFDWVVARIGSCFPTTIITRVLNCGLKDFCSAGRDVIERDSAARKKIPKMASVVGILGHLASKHQQDIRKALMALFEEGLESSGDMVRVTTVPFLLQLASMSPMLLQVLTTDLIKALTPSVLNRLHLQFSGWTMANPGEYNSFLSLVVHLLSKCDVGAFDILNFVVSSAAPTDPDDPSEERVLEAVQETCVELINMLLFELQRGVHSKRRDSPGAGDLPLLDGLAKETDHLVPLLLESAHSKKLPWLKKLMVFTAVRSGENFAATVLSDIITKATNPSQLALYFHLQEAVEKSLRNVAKMMVESLYGTMATSPPATLVQMLHNLRYIIIGEKKRSQLLQASLRFLSQAVQEDLHRLCDVLQHPHVDVSVAGLHVLSEVGVLQSADTSVLTRLSSAVLALFFRVLWDRLHKGDHPAGETDQRGLQLCLSCMRLLGRQPFVQSLMLHHLLGDTVSQDNAALFGGKVTTPRSASGGAVKGGVSLLKENRRQGLSIPLPRTHASVFHAGVIGMGLKREVPITTITKEWILRNHEALQEAIWACCQSVKDSAPFPPRGPASLPALSLSLRVPTMSDAAARTLGCAIVEVVTMDTLYNDVTWPDPEFSKVTLERDLYVWKTMEDHPVLWGVLRAVSGSSVLMYYCSPVLKSLMAKVVSTLETTRVRRMTDLPLFYERAWWLVGALAQGKILPPPLSSMGELFPFITPYEGYILLLSAWRYIKENPPVLNKEQMEGRRCEVQHAQVLQAVLNSNIDTLGHLYPRIFNT